MTKKPLLKQYQTQILVIKVESHKIYQVMSQKELITIIIPIYNVASYMRECIDSVLAQTYKNLEIILVNDGSTDNSGEICDAYVEQDSRIRVIHRGNGGPSVARNEALDIMQGDYVTFIDSDDIIHPRYIEILHNNLSTHNADISSVGLSTNQKNICANPNINNSNLVLSSTDAVRHILYQHILDNAVSGKLYKSILWSDVRFKPNIYYEDLEVFYHVFFKAKMVVHLNYALYYYRQRKTSRMGSFTLKRADVLDITDEIESFIGNYFPELLPAAKDRKFSANMNILWLMSASGTSDEAIIARCWKNITSLRLSSLLNPNVRLKNKIGALASYAGLRLTQAILSRFK